MDAVVNAQDMLREAYSCLMRGDLKGRDEWCELARTYAEEQRDRLMAPAITAGARGSRENPIKLVAQPDGSYAPERVP